jgi:hypothetical protein
MPSARKLIARCVQRRRGAAASVEGKSEKVAVSFGAYLLCKSCSLSLELRGDRGEAEGSPVPGPLLSHPMTVGSGPPVKGVAAGGRGKGGIRTARAAGRARMR